MYKQQITQNNKREGECRGQGLGSGNCNQAEKDLSYSFTNSDSQVQHGHTESIPMGWSLGICIKNHVLFFFFLFKLRSNLHAVKCKESVTV